MKLLPACGAAFDCVVHLLEGDVLTARFDHASQRCQVDGLGFNGYRGIVMDDEADPVARQRKPTSAHVPWLTIGRNEV